MERNRTRAVAVAAAVLLSGCAGNLRVGSILPGDALLKPRLVNLGERRAVIVLRDPAVPTRLEFKNDAGVALSYGHLRGAVEQPILSMLQGHVAAVDVAFGEAPAGYDLYVMPEVTATGSGTWKMRCAATVRVKVTDGEGRVIGADAETQDAEYVLLAVGVASCQALVSSCLSKAASAALEQADAALAHRVGRS